MNSTIYQNLHQLKQVVRAPADQMGSHLGTVELEINYMGMLSEVYVTGLRGLAGRPVNGSMGDLNYTITSGSQEIYLPFSLFL